MILRKGIEAEAVVRTTWRHEVQVRVHSGELLWRTVKTILRTLPPASPEDPIPFPASAASPSSEAPAAVVADSPADGNDQSAQQEEKEEEPLVVIDLPAPKKDRKNGQKRTSSRRRK